VDVQKCFTKSDIYCHEVKSICPAKNLVLINVLLEWWNTLLTVLEEWIHDR